MTLNDIAKAAGVSVSTVSKALRGSNDLNKETAKKIQIIAEKLQYKPKSISEDKECFDQFVGIICPEIRSNFYSQIVTQITDLMFERDIGVMVCFTNFDNQREVRYLKLMVSKKAAGVFCLTEDPASARNLIAISQSGKIPVIQVGINVDANEFDNIYVDDGAGINYAVEHLVSLGHRDIAFIGDSYAGSRLVCFEKAMRQHELKVDDDYRCLDYDRFEQCGYQQMTKLLSLKRVPTAIIAQYDEIAVGAMRKLYESGMHIPEDMSVIGMENVTYSVFLKDAVTTIAGNIGEMGRICVDLMMQKIRNKDYKLIQRIQIIPELLIRETTGPAKKR